MICKYCGKEIPKGAVWNPDKYGNGYHYRCLIEMEFARATRVKRIPLDRVKQAREEIIKESFPEDEEYSVTKLVYLGDVLAVLDKLIAEAERCHEEKD